MPDPVSQFPDLPDTFDLAELKGVFSDEEIKALSEGDDPVVVLPDPNAKAEPDPASLEAEDDEVLRTALEAQKPAAPAAPAPVVPDPAVQPAATAEEEPDEPPIEIPDTAAAEATVQALDAQMDALQQQYDDGDLTAAEMKAQVNALIKEQAKAQAQIDRAAEIIQEAQNKANDLWINSLNKFKDAGNADLWSDDHRPGFDASLKRVTNFKISPENAGKSFATLIKIAAAQYAATYEATTGQKLVLGKTAAPPTPADPGKPSVPAVPKRPDAPQLLGDLNGDGGMSINDGTFAAIDKVAASDPFQAERMMSTLSPDAMDAYLRGA